MFEDKDTRKIGDTFENAILVNTDDESGPDSDNDPCVTLAKFDPDITKSYSLTSLKLVKSIGDGHCILYSILSAMKYENVKGIPSKESLLDSINFEILNHLDYYGNFINSIDTDCIEELERYKSNRFRSYNTDTNDLIIQALSNILKCRILLLQKIDNEYKLEHPYHCINPTREIANTTFTFKFLFNGSDHYDALIDIDKYTDSDFNVEIHLSEDNLISSGKNDIEENEIKENNEEEENEIEESDNVEENEMEESDDIEENEIEESDNVEENEMEESDDIEENDIEKSGEEEENENEENVMVIEEEENDEENEDEQEGERGDENTNEQEVEGEDGDGILFEEDNSVQFYGNDKSLPMYSTGFSHPYKTEEVAASIINEDVPTVKIASAPPVYVDKNVTFMVDATKLGDPRDVMFDTIPQLRRTKTKTFYFSFDEDKLVKTEKSCSEYTVCRYIYSHTKEKDFHKVIITVKDGIKQLPLIFVQYYFEGEERPIEHSKENTTRRTYNSVKQKIQDLSHGTKKPKEIYHDLTANNGSFEKARTVNDLPTGYKQIYNVNRNKDKNDELIKILDTINKTKEDGSLPFIRDIRFAPEFSVFLCFDRQLHDIYRFCANKYPFSIFGVDPTFNLGEYNVTVTTYRHPMLSSKKGVHPVMLGPVLIHSHKTYCSYYTLPSNMIRLYPELKNILSIGTDDEPALYNSLLDCFQSSLHLLCNIHVVDAIKRTCEKLKIDHSPYLKEIMGVTCDSLRIKGLVDCRNEREFDEMYANLKTKWLQRDGEKIVKYMDCHKKDKMKHKMRGDIRTACGLGDPPALYDQNANECMNSVLKRGKNTDKLKLSEIIDLIKAEVMSQEEKIKLALINRGEYTLHENFKKKFIISDKLFYERKDLRVKKLKSFNSFLPESGLPTPIIVGKSLISKKKTKVINLNLDYIPDVILSDMEKEGSRLIDNDEVTKFNDYVYFVKNDKDITEPFKVTFDPRTNKFMCEQRKNCERFKAFRICSHIISVASLMNMLDKYSKILTDGKNKSQTKILVDQCNSGKDKNAGKKPIKRKGDPNKKPSKVVRIIDPPNYIPMRTFTLKKLRGNISSCFGCLKKIISVDSDSLTIVYRDDQFKYGTKTLKKLQNVHFHPLPSCILKKYPEFEPKDLHIPADLSTILSKKQRESIDSLFGI